MQYGDFAQVYDELMQSVDYDMWAEYLHKLICAYACGTKVAECACGTGSLTRRLKRKGYDISGFDISDSMLMCAAHKARSEGLSVPFVCMDMRTLSLHKPHDAIVAACDGVNYLTSTEDVRSFFESAFRNLKSGGALFFDISTEYKLKNILGMNTFSHDEGDCTYIWRNMYDDKSRLCEMNLTFFVKQGALYRRFDERHLQMAHRAGDLTESLKSVGFTDIAVYDCFTENAPRDDSERIQFVAKKA